MGPSSCLQAPAAVTASAPALRWMDFITSFDIRLEKDVYYAGETIVGCVVLENSEPIKIRGVQVFLRGRARAQWKVLKSGESRTLKDDQYLLNEKCVIWGNQRDKHNEDLEDIQILQRGLHQFNFTFQLPQCQMPCSLETKSGTIRYYVKVIIDIPYASSPQGIKYFTFVGPHIDCMDEKYLMPMTGQDHKVHCFRCCKRGTIALRVVLERSAYCCGESIQLRAHIENHLDSSVTLCTRLYQHVEYRIERGANETKSVVSMVLEHQSPTVTEDTIAKFDPGESQPIKVPVVPPTMVGSCRLMQVYYVLKVSIEDERKNESLLMSFPLTIATVPYRSNPSQVYSVTYDFCVDYVETGKYISTEFRLGHVYDGENGTSEELQDIILYRPVYVRMADKTKVEKFLDSRLSDSQQSLHGVNGKQGSQKSITTLPPSEAVVQSAVVQTANGDVSPRAALEDSSNEAIQLY